MSKESCDEDLFKVDTGLLELFRRGLPEEDVHLEDLIKSDGSPDTPLVIWEERKLLVDGHRRYALCKKYDLPFSVIYKSFKDEDAVKRYMIKRQLSNRNLTDHERAVYIKREVDMISKEEGVFKTTAVKKISHETGTSISKIWSDIAYAESVEGLEPEWVTAIDKKVIKLSRKDLARMAALEPELQKDIYAKFIEYGVKEAVTEAISEAYGEEVVVTEPEIDFSSKEKPAATLDDYAGYDEFDIDEISGGAYDRKEASKILRKIEDCEKVGALLAKLCDELFSGECLGDETKKSSWKRKCDYGHRQIANVLMEVRGII